MATMLQGSIRSRFHVLSRELLFGGVQCPQPMSWCVFQSLLGRGRTKLLALDETLPSRRLAGSHLDIKKRHRVSGSTTRFGALAVIHVNATLNNTVITISDHKGKMLGWVSAGTEGFKNARRGSSTAGRQAGVSAAYKAISLGVEKARIKVRGIGMGRQGALNGMEGGGLKMVSVTDVTPVPHNGCRPRKTRRM